MIGAATRTFALLGDPVSHSLSPRIQNAALRALDLDGIYVALRCVSDDVPGLLRGLARAGGGGNVTIPHKQVAAASVDHPSDRVRATGACNTFWAEPDGIHGENTDVPGLRGALTALLGGSARGLRVVVVGAGGAARGTLVALHEEEAGEVLAWNRTAARAESLVREVGGGWARAVPSLEAALATAPDLVVHTTSLGLHDDDPLPFDPAGLPRKTAVLDLVYRPAETALVRAARAEGLRAADGGEMLVRQGAEAFRLWWRRDPPLEAMRAALEAVRLDRARETTR